MCENIFDVLFELCSAFSVNYHSDFTCFSLFVVSFQQTAPDNSLICPGQQLVYFCTTASTGALEWQSSGEQSVLFTISDSINHTKVQEQFTFQLIDVVMDGLMLKSTATAQMANSSLDGLGIECNDGLNQSTLYVDVAGKCACI